MLSATLCQERRKKFWEHFDSANSGAVDELLLGDPIHLMYLTNVFIDPFSLGAGFGAYLRLRRDGHATLIHEDLSPKSVEQAHVDATQLVHWYDGEHPGRGPRRLALLGTLAAKNGTLRVHDSPHDPLARTIVDTLARMRRQKYPDEIALLRHCLRAAEAGQAWALRNIEPGMTELDVYAGINEACIAAAGHPVIVYGDFVVCPGPERRIGLPTSRVLAPGDMMILDFSVVIGGYRGDTSNTLVVGAKPTAEQQRLYELCRQAMAAGEERLAAGTACAQVYEAVRSSFQRSGAAEHFPHHAGHGLGLSHPEAPFFVRHADEGLMVGDVVTLEPGLYVAGAGGIRIEHNYLITKDGYERLSDHTIVPGESR
jgi:Xaa-Pro aminopeptidase